VEIAMQNSPMRIHLSQLKNQLTMKKQISFSGAGQRADIGEMKIFRILPNRYADAVGPFVFLDHIAPTLQTSSNKRTGAHPHRGIATLTYVLNGEDEHFDSAGNYAAVNSGGVQWMKAGSGIIHDESVSADSKSDNKLIHGFQFWINLPAKNKTEKPEYIAVQSDSVPRKSLINESGWIKIIAGEYEDRKSVIPQYSEQFIFHIHLNPGKQFTLNNLDNLETAAFLPLENAFLNDREFQKGEFIEFETGDGIIEIKNNGEIATDIILFGGERYPEPIVAQGPFVMNSHQQIAEAYKDFYAGKYGEIKSGIH